MPIVNDNTINSLAKRYDANGTVWIKVKFIVGATAKTGTIIRGGRTGYENVAIYAVSSTTSALAYVGFPDQTYASNTIGWAQIGGPITSAIFTTSTTATAGQYAIWLNATLVGNGEAARQSSSFGVFTASDTSTNTHDLVLFPDPITGQ